MFTDSGMFKTDTQLSQAKGLWKYVVHATFTCTHFHIFIYMYICICNVHCTCICIPTIVVIIQYFKGCEPELSILKLTVGTGNRAKSPIME